jgi:hypothetical protein
VVSAPKKDVLDNNNRAQVDPRLLHSTPPHSVQGADDQPDYRFSIGSLPVWAKKQVRTVGRCHAKFEV